MGALVVGAGRAIAAASPAVIARLLPWLQRASGVALNTAEDVLKWMKGNPLSAALVFEGLIEAGAAVKDVTKHITGNDPEVKDLRESLERKSAASGSAVDGSVDRLVALQAAGRTLLRHFGSLEEAARVRDALTLTDDELTAIRRVGLGSAR